MSYSLEEFMKANEQLEQKRALERAKEREEDLIKIRQMIQSGVSSEVSKVLEPITSKHNLLEAESNARFANLEAEISGIKDVLNRNWSNTVCASNVIPQLTPTSSVTSAGQLDKVKASINSSKKIIYLQPIYQKRTWRGKSECIRL